MSDQKSGRKVLWEEMRSEEFEQLDKDRTVVVIPTGSIEQHGPHLPVNTDASIAAAIARRAAASIDSVRVVVAPTIACGVTPIHTYRPGTISLRVQTFIDLMADVCENIVRNGFRRIVILNGHGGNCGPLEATALRLYGQRVRIAVMTYWDAMADVIAKVCLEGGWGHGSEGETSLQLVLQPSLVDDAQISKRLVTDVRASAGIDSDVAAGVYMVPDFRQYIPLGVCGDPTLASPEKGEVLLAAATQALVRFIEKWAQVRIE